MNMIQAAGEWMREFIDGTTLPPAPAQPRREPALRVLLVDDNEVNRLVAIAQLQHWGIEPTLACNGAQAVELATTQAFDLVLMDVAMPVMNGLEATARIRRHEFAHPERPRVPVVAYTSGLAADDPAVMARHGLDDVLHSRATHAWSASACCQRWCAISLD